MTSCATPTEKTAADRLMLAPVGFNDLPGWGDDRQSEALGALAKSCAVISKKSPDDAMGIAGIAGDWQPVCAALTAVTAQDDAMARAFFERWFTPYAASGRNGDEGLFTGYYEAGLRGAWQQGGKFQTPLWQRPDDLLSADLGAFRSDLKGVTIHGKIEGKHFVPYDDRATITQNGLTGRAQPLVWVDDLTDAFFLEIQGSGRVIMADGTVLRVGYDGTNGRSYQAIGRVLKEMGELPPDQISMQTIRAWLKAHPDRAQDLMNKNPSYVFFKTGKNNKDGPIGAEGVTLTPLRSLAVDPAFVPLGVLVWLNIECRDCSAPSGATATTAGQSIQRLVVAQDTGGAIKGAVRGDLFWGFGAEAEQQAGIMQARGRYYLLLPKSVTP